MGLDAFMARLFARQCQSPSPSPLPSEAEVLAAALLYAARLPGHGNAEEFEALSDQLKMLAVVRCVLTAYELEDLSDGCEYDPEQSLMPSCDGDDLSLAEEMLRERGMSELEIACCMGKANRAELWLNAPVDGATMREREQQKCAALLVAGSADEAIRRSGTLVSPGGLSFDWAALQEIRRHSAAKSTHEPPAKRVKR